MATSSMLPPTNRQLRYLRALAERTGTTFSVPANRAEASRSIEALRGRKREPEAPWNRPGSAAERPPTYGTAVHESEVSGFGATAHWRHTGPTTPRTAPPPKPGRTSREVGRYHLGDAARVLSVEHNGDAVRLIDQPVSGEGASYLVEPDIRMDDDGSLQALVSDYVTQAERLGDVPMSRLAALPRPDADTA